MKIHRILDDYLHGQIRKKSGDWDDITNVADIADSFTEDKKNPFDENHWREKIYENTGNYKSEKNKENNKLNVIV